MGLLVSKNFQTQFSQSKKDSCSALFQTEGRGNCIVQPLFPEYRFKKETIAALKNARSIKTARFSTIEELIGALENQNNRS